MRWLLTLPPPPYTPSTRPQAVSSGDYAKDRDAGGGALTLLAGFAKCARDLLLGAPLAAVANLSAALPGLLEQVGGVYGGLCMGADP